MKNIDISKTVKNAHIAYEKAQYNQSLSLIKKVNKLEKTQNVENVLFEARLLFKLSKLDKALEIYNNLAQTLNDSLQLREVYKSVGEIEVLRREYGNAITALEKCIAIDGSINSADTVLALCKLYRKNGYNNQCKQLANKLKNWSQYYGSALHQLILLAKKEGSTETIISLSKELSANYQQVEEFYIYYCIQTFLSVGCFNEGKALLDRAANKFGNVPWIVRTNAEFCFKSKEYDKVIRLLNDKLIQELPKWIYKSLVYQLRAKAFEKTGEFNMAFQDFSSMAAVVKSQLRVAKVNDDVKGYAKLNTHSLPTLKEYNNKFPLAFMVGFPRSGTTMLDTILSTQDNVVTLSEVDAISHVINVMRTKLNKRYPKDLVDLSPIDIQSLRESYYDFVSELPQASSINEDTLVIDKMPLNTIHIPLIMLMFPKSKFIFSLRHPLDVCLSNFQQDYVLNQEMIHFIEIQGCANRYNDVMNLLESYRNKLNPDIHFVKYEDLVLSLTNEAPKLFEFLGIKTSQNYTSFYKLANKKFIDTPSRDQVKQQLYTSSLHKWKSYSEHLKDIVPTLISHMNRYGYEYE